MSNIQKSGILAPRYVELPYETAEEKAAADADNKELAAVGWRTCRMAYDWGFVAYDDLKADPRKNALFKSGDLVRVFKSVSDGDVLWEGVIDYDCEKYHHGFQKGMPPNEWVGMFYRCWPARLERADGTVLFGALEAFAETGTEGEIWSVHEYGKQGYDGLNCLRNGDKLTVYTNVRDGEIDWEGPVAFGPEKVERLGPWAGEIMRRTTHMDTMEWLQMSYQHRPVVVTPK